MPVPGLNNTNKLAAKIELSLLSRNLSGIFSACYRD